MRVKEASIMEIPAFRKIKEEYLEIGRQEERQAIVANLKEDGLTPEQIARMLRTSVEEIQRLLNKNAR